MTVPERREMTVPERREMTVPERREMTVPEWRGPTFQRCELTESGSGSLGTAGPRPGRRAAR
jgi:hypothetical protein